MPPPPPPPPCWSLLLFVPHAWLSKCVSKASMICAGISARDVRPSTPRRVASFSCCSFCLLSFSSSEALSVSS